jgi:Acetyltransferase (GNAT) domain
MWEHPMESAQKYFRDLLTLRASRQLEPKAKDDRLTLRTIHDLDELEALRPIWTSWPGTRDSDLDFFSAMVRSRGRGCRPHVVVLAYDTRPDAILIGLCHGKKLRFTMGYRTVCQPEVNVLEFVSGSLRGNASEENCAALVQQVMKSLNKGDADLALWKQLHVQSSLYNCVLQLPRFFARDHSRCFDDRWLMDFPKGLDGFFMSLGRSQRSKLRRKYKKALNHFEGKMQIRCSHSLADLDLAISDVEEIASKTNQRRLFGSGFFDTPQIREQMAVAAGRGWLRIYILYLEEKPVAFWVGTLYERCLQADYVGYDPSWGEFSPGILLFLTILDDLRNEDIKTVDLGRGGTQLQQCFADLRRVESNVHIYASTLRGIKLNLLRTAIHRTTNCAKSLLRRTHNLAWARRTLRNQLARQRSKHCSTAGGEIRVHTTTNEHKGGGQPRRCLQMLPSVSHSAGVAIRSLSGQDKFVSRDEAN